MKLTGRTAARFCTAPASDCIGALLCGDDAGLIAARRTELVSAILGGVVDDLRLTRLNAAEARRDPAGIDAAMRAGGFFPGRRVVIIDGATDALAKPLAGILSALTANDAFLVVTAGVLKSGSGLRKLFGTGERLAALGFSNEAPRPGDIGPLLAERGLDAGVTRDAALELASIGAGMDHGSFLRLLDLVAIHGLDRSAPLDAATVLALAPSGLAAEMDRFVEAVADGRPHNVGPLLRRLRAGGATPVGLMLGLQRHFRTLLVVASAEGGTNVGFARVRPPLWGRRRDMAEAQLRRWGPARLEQACRLLFEADGRIRSSSRAPEFAVIERSALRLAIMAQR